MPLSVRVGLSVVLFAVAIAVSLTAWRAQAGRLRRQGLAGVRTPSAMVDDAAFDRANRAAAPVLYAGASVAAVLGILVATLGGRFLGGPAAVIVGGIAVGGLILLAGIRGERAARDGLTPGTGPGSPPAGATTPEPARGTATRTTASTGGSPAGSSSSSSAGSSTTGGPAAADGTDAVHPPAGAVAGAGAPPTAGSRPHGGATSRTGRSRRVSGRDGGQRPPSR